MKETTPLYNYLIIFIPFILFLIGNDSSTNYYQKLIVISAGLGVVSIFFIASLVVSELFPNQKIWITPFLSLSIYVAFSYAQWGFSTLTYLSLFLFAPLLIATLISRISLVEKFFSTFVYTVTLVSTLQFLYLQYDAKEGSVISANQLMNVDQVSSTPNIYLVLLDAYAREDSLSELGLDNGGFINFLETKGFFVADKSNANYISTRLSLYTLYMMQYPEDAMNLDSPVLADVLKGSNSVIANLRSIGYTHLRMGPNQSFPQDCSGLEDLCLYKINDINGTAYGHGNIYIHILSMSPLLKVIRYFDLFSAYTTPDIYEKATIKNANESLQNRSDDLLEPLFVEINVWQPHAPYLFQENCNRRSEVVIGFDAWIDSSKGPYIDEIICANFQLVEFVNRITSEDKEAIIIIMSDHGHSFFFDRETNVEEYSDVAMKARLANLVSVRLPQKCSQNLYPTITPVNIFPIVFACLKNTQPELTKDFSYKHQLGNDHKSDKKILVDTSIE